MDALQQSMNTMMELLNAKMVTFQEDLQRISTTPATISSLAADFTAFRSFAAEVMNNLQHQVQILARQMEQLEMRSRRKILLFHGVQERGSDDSASEVVRIVTEHFKLPDFSANDISRSHRLGRSSADKPKPILVKFRSAATRNKIWFAKTALKDSGVTMSEFLTKSRHDAFMAARQQFGVKRCWTRDGYVIVITSDGLKHRVSTVDEVQKLIQVSAAVPVDSGTTKALGKTDPAKVTAAASSRLKRDKKK
ncbi:uncharacterized protein LOC128201783 [Galleria mellonella]|uniref:Uncharacterized protein LOC128201783 n=1 Tax=Galleria mellonella TaxID=7137 RepID=A0ABM3MWZ4_GALME|nr:uncharacterized protein LOC128201783 [Galleria mellonella]